MWGRLPNYELRMQHCHAKQALRLKWQRSLKKITSSCWGSSTSWGRCWIEWEDQNCGSHSSISSILMTALAASRHTTIAGYERLAPNSFSHNPAYLVTKDEIICFDRHNLWFLFCPLSSSDKLWRNLWFRLEGKHCCLPAERSKQHKRTKSHHHVDQDIMEIATKLGTILGKGSRRSWAVTYLNQIICTQIMTSMFNPELQESFHMSSSITMSLTYQGLVVIAEKGHLGLDRWHKLLRFHLNPSTAHFLIVVWI